MPMSVTAFKPVVNVWNATGGRFKVIFDLGGNETIQVNVLIPIDQSASAQPVATKEEALAYAKALLTKALDAELV